MSQKIHKLSSELIAQIAAGEVIERPAYAVKELIDNSIDAGATEISVILTNYGLKKIEVIDNGHGMSQEDVLECFKIHTTSKISNSDKLLSIRSLGFRGEALASIAAVSELKIKSRQTKDIGGFEVVIKNGKIVSSTPIGMPVGTSVEISNIFSAVPARKKFLKSPLLEFKKIIEIFLSFGVGHPNIHLTLTHNDKKIYDLMPKDLILHRLEEIVSPDIFQNLLPIKYEDSYIKVFGFLGKPQVTNKSQNKQFIYINGRRVFDHLTNQSLRDAYGTLLPSRSFPVSYLFITVPYEMVDVNIHPRKEQVAFFNSQFFYDTLFKATKEFLSENDLTFSNVVFKKSEITDILAGRILKQETQTFEVKESPWTYQCADISQVNNLYILLPGNNGFTIFDQHACHERILFEQYKKQFAVLKKNVITLPQSLDLKLSISEKVLLANYIQEFKKIGLLFDLQNQNLIQIPKIFQDRDLGTLIKELLAELDLNEKVQEIDDINLSIIKYLACKEAIKAGDKLSQAEMTQLIKELDKTEENTTCPHGRPTRLTITNSELAHYFRR